MKMLMDRWRGGKAARIIMIMLMVTVTPGGAAFDSIEERECTQLRPLVD
jgi:hypothetical protein